MKINELFKGSFEPGDLVRKTNNDNPFEYAYGPVLKVISRKGNMLTVEDPDGKRFEINAFNVVAKK